MSLGGCTLLQQALVRGQACGAQETLIVTNQDHMFLTQGLLDEMQIARPVRLLLEPKGRNTAPAIALAALASCETSGPDTVMMVLPADHLIPDNEAFVANALEAARHALMGQLVVFGISPTSPETGFGYIEVAQLSRQTQPAIRFVEKPDLVTAQGYLATGRFYWNSGMFCFTAGSVLAALREFAPQVMESAEMVWKSRIAKGQATFFDPQDFSLLPDISIDYAVMERASNVSLVPAKFSWSDVGSWPAVANAHPADANGNTFTSDVVSIESTGTHVQVESHGPKLVATVGVNNLVIVDTPDALLVAHKDSAQKVKSVVDALKGRNHDSTHLPAAVHRPWGTYAALKEEDGYKVKRITVKPGHSLSLQYHHQRAEHWVVVKGTASVQVGEQEYPTVPGEHRYIPLGAKHRLTNVGADELVLIEVQCGDYLGEDDIVRLADSYGRT